MPWARRWRITDRDKWRRVLRALLEFDIDFARTPVELVAREELVPLSQPQRRLFHAICEDAAPHFGLTPGEYKQEVKRIYFGDGWQQMSTEDLPHEGYGQLIECAYRLASENGVFIPDRRAR